MQLPDYYQVLGVANGETPENIKRAFRKLARRYHPDVSKEKNAERRMKEINEAYDVLSDPQKRAEYDTARNAAMRGFDHNTSSDSQQEEFFRGFGNGSFHFTSNSAESLHDFGGFGDMGNIF
jgi:curved DNA-binding protein